MVRNETWNSIFNRNIFRVTWARNIFRLKLRFFPRVHTIQTYKWEPLELLEMKSGTLHVYELVDGFIQSTVEMDPDATLKKKYHSLR